MSGPRQLVSDAYSRLGRAYLSAQGRRALQRLGYQGLFDQRPPNSIPPVWGDLWHLYRTVRERQPALILEFGSGCSTIVMAQALADNGLRHGATEVVSLESDTHWGAVAEDSIPRSLAPFVRIVVTPAEKSEHGRVPVWRYRDVPAVTPELVYLDGPALTPDRKVAADLLDMEDRLAPGTRLIVDGRSRNCAFLAENFSRRWSRSWNRFLKWTTFDLVA